MKVIDQVQIFYVDCVKAYAKFYQTIFNFLYESVLLVTAGYTSDSLEPLKELSLSTRAEMEEHHG